MKHCGTATLESERLVLRRFTAGDAEAMYRNWACDSEVTKYLTWPPHDSVRTTEAVLRTWAASYRDDNYYQWAIVLKENGNEPVGSIAAVSLNEELSIAHIGYCLGRRWWHRGIMSEALATVIDFFFGCVEANRVESRHDPNNPHSGMVMRKCGMKYEGTLRSADRNNQGLCDCCWYAILRSEWERERDLRSHETYRNDTRRKKEKTAMRIATPPMGWNSWNTFGSNISDELIVETARAMKEKGYLAAGYRYVVIDDCWSLRQRGADGRIVPDPAKFPRGMKAVADDLHEMGFLFGMYSCAGVQTCAGYPASYDHEFVDAQTFADWGVDYLKYDFCNFPANADNRNRYATMSLALKATGRDILFAACNWGSGEPWKWMKSVGAHMYRSTGDIQDNFVSFANIARSQLDNLCMNGADCFNDMDMLTIGMYGKGNVAMGKACTDEEYQTQFALWCMAGVPLMLGGDVRSMTPFAEQLVLNKGLLRINQDAECRPPHIVYRDRVITHETDPETGATWHEHKDCGLTMFKHLTDGEFAVGYFNFAPGEGEVPFIFSDAGLPYGSGYALQLTDAITGEDLGAHRDYYHVTVPAHGSRVLLARLVRA